MKENVLVSSVCKYVEREGLRDLPWRKKPNFYTVLVSEIMLQQTQVERVVPKFELFLSTFPNIEDLAKAKKREVLSHWSGLGYNRRAVFLHQAAHYVVTNGIPKHKEEIMNLPGVGIYTANAIEAFVYNKESIVIETNIRTAVIEHCFKRKQKVNDTEISLVLKEALHTPQVRKKGMRFWYSALMDYGSFLKKNAVSHNKKVDGYTKQKPFKHSFRYVRSTLLKKIVAEKKGCTLYILKKEINDDRCTDALKSLIKDNLIVYENKKYTIK